LKLRRERGDEILVAETLRFMSDANRLLFLPKEGILQVEEAFWIYERLDDTLGQAQSLQGLARLLRADGQLDAAEEAASRAIGLLSDKDEQFTVCECYRILGEVYYSKGEVGKAINHLETAIRIATAFSWHGRLFWIHHSLVQLYSSENRFDDAHAHIERAKSHTTTSLYNLGRAMQLRARVWYKQRRLEEAKSEALRAVDVFEKLGAAEELRVCKTTLRDIEEAINQPAASH